MYHLIKNSFERKQKGAVSALCVIFIVLAGSFVSCAQKAVVDESDEGGEVPYVPCPCENNDGPLATIKGEIRFYNVTNTPDDSNTDYVLDWPDERMTIYPAFTCIGLSSDNSNLEGLGHLNGGTIFHVCNLPDFAQEWYDGCIVYYEGNVYPYCEKFGCRDLCYSIILTSLKKVE